MGRTSLLTMLAAPSHDSVLSMFIPLCLRPQESEACTGGTCFSKGRGKPLLDLAELEVVSHQRRSLCTLLDSIQPGLHLLCCQHVSLPSDGQCTLQDLKAILPAYAASQVLGDIDLPLSLSLFCIGAGQSGDKREQLLPLLISGFIVQEHRQAADRAREAVGHGLDGPHRLTARLSIAGCVRTKD